MGDYYVTVCDHCRCASCWQGGFGCDAYCTAGSVRVLASELAQERREHPSYFSRERLESIGSEIEEVQRG